MSAGTITTEVDLLGRVVRYTDVWGNVTTTTYDQPGRAVARSGPAGLMEMTYDVAGRPLTQRLDGVTLATATYVAAGDASTNRLNTTSYPTGAGNGGNGTSGRFSYDVSGAVSDLTWLSPSGPVTTPYGAAITRNDVTYDILGRVTDSRTDGVEGYSGGADYTYDGASRLTNAWYRDATNASTSVSYAFASSGNCGLAPNAGRNTNRTSSTVGGVTTTYCYDNADRLTLTSDVRFGSPSYDSHGNTTAFAGHSLTYDGADRHVQTAKGTTTVRYVRDSTDRIVARLVNGATVARYGFTGTDDNPAIVMNASNSVIERFIGLLGGVAVTRRSTGDVWSYPNIQGSIAAVANGAGVKQGGTYRYDPYGEPVTGFVDNAAGDFDFGWLGQHQRGLEHETGVEPMIEMGARVYAPALGRFLEVDPVEGGSANDYDYVNGEPPVTTDLDGKAPGCTRYELDNQRCHTMAGVSQDMLCGLGSRWCTRDIRSGSARLRERSRSETWAALRRVNARRGWEFPSFTRTRCVVSLFSTLVWPGRGSGPSQLGAGANCGALDLPPPQRMA